MLRHRPSKGPSSTPQSTMQTTPRQILWKKARRQQENSAIDVNDEEIETTAITWTTIIADVKGSRAAAGMVLRGDAEVMPLHRVMETCMEAECAHSMLGHRCRRGVIAKEEAGSKRLQGCKWRSWREHARHGVEEIFFRIFCIIVSENDTLLRLQGL